MSRGHCPYQCPKPFLKCPFISTEIPCPSPCATVARQGGFMDDSTTVFLVCGLCKGIMLISVILLKKGWRKNAEVVEQHQMVIEQNQAVIGMVQGQLEEQKKREE